MRHFVNKIVKKFIVKMHTYSVHVKLVKHIQKEKTMFENLRHNKINIYECTK